MIAGILEQWQNMPAWSNEAFFWVVFGAVGPVGLAYFIPIGSSLLIGLVFKESMNNGLFFGAVLIAMGAWLVRYAGRKC